MSTNDSAFGPEHRAEPPEHVWTVRQPGPSCESQETEWRATEDGMWVDSEFFPGTQEIAREILRLAVEHARDLARERARIRKRLLTTISHIDLPAADCPHPGDMVVLRDELLAAIDKICPEPPR